MATGVKDESREKERNMPRGERLEIKMYGGGGGQGRKRDVVQKSQCVNMGKKWKSFGGRDTC